MQETELLYDSKENVRYIKGKLLGTGGFAKCFEATRESDGKVFAVKVIKKKSVSERRQRYKLLAEIKLHRNLKHRHIVEFISAFQDKENIYMVLEHCRNYTLKDLVKRRKRLTEMETRVYVSQVTRAIQHIHSHSIIHRDLKLGNILINSQMDIKICDFGLSTKIKTEGQIKKTICGTPNYIAPQTIQELGHSYQVDIWAIGVCMYTFLFGKPPFQDTTVQQTYENIKNNKFHFPPSIVISSAAKDLISKILVLDPSQRCSLQQILQHQFIKNNIQQQLPLSSLAIPPQQIEIEVQAQAQEKEAQIVESHCVVTFNAIIFVRECFKYEGVTGYLLSNGGIGVLEKQAKLGLFYQFGTEYYLLMDKHNKNKVTMSENNPLVKKLNHFKSYFVTKYGVFKLEEMNKRCKKDQLVYLEKTMEIGENQIATRLSNNIVQMHFQDLSSVGIDKNQTEGIYFIHKSGKIQEIMYQQCKKTDIKVKIRRFSNLMRVLSQADKLQSQSEISYKTN